MKKNRLAESPIAIVGVAAICPGSSDSAGFWMDIVNGRDLIKTVPESHWLVEDYYCSDPKASDKVYSHKGSFIDPVAFYPMEFGIPPSILSSTDPTQLISLMVTRKLLINAFGPEYFKQNHENTSVILGVTSAQELYGYMVSRIQHANWRQGLKSIGYSEEQIAQACEAIAKTYSDWDENTFPGLLGNVVAGRVANRFNLNGTNFVTDAACASSLAALYTSINELQLGRADVVITGGADTINDPFMFMCFSKTPALSPTQDCRALSDTADGTVLGEGFVFFALKRLADAEKENNHIYAVIKGVGTASDGRSKSIYAPLDSGQALAIKRAYKYAGYDCDTVELVEAHGTGTVAGDEAEFSGLSIGFEKDERRQACALGSIKSQIGHTKACSGAASLFKITQALLHQVIPPTIKVEKPNEKLVLKEGPFYINTLARPWFKTTQFPRRASCSSFGFGGTNFHVTLEEYLGPNRAKKLPTYGSQLFLFSGKDLQSLQLEIDEVHVQDRFSFETLVALSWETQQKNHAGNACRLAILAKTKEDLKAKLVKAQQNLASRSQDIQSPDKGIFVGLEKNAGLVGFIYPNLQRANLYMGREALLSFDALKTPFEGSLDVSALVYPPLAFTEAEREQHKTRLVESPLKSLASALLCIGFTDWLGDYLISPDVAAGIGLGEMLGLYAAKGITQSVVKALLRQYPHYSSNNLMQQTKYQQAWEQVLHAFKFDALQCPVYSASSGAFYPASANMIKHQLATVLVNPKSEQEILRHLYDLGVRTFIDIAPGASNYEQILPEKDVLVISLDVEEGNSNILSVLAKLFCRGFNPDFTKHWQEFQCDTTELIDPKGPCYWLDGSCYEKPYPPKVASSKQAPKIEEPITTINKSNEEDQPMILPTPLWRMSDPIEAPDPIKIPDPTEETVVNNQAIAEEPRDDTSLYCEQLLAVVAEKTGYPSDMLSLNMSLESDLGIDSIKRVEIFSLLGEKLPSVREIDANRLSTLTTLAEVVDFITKKKN